MTFVSSFHLPSGKSQWIEKDSDYDYNQEIARSAYADMLHDTERNKKYEAGLIAAMESMRSQGRACNVLDIGTGTGLLSMMAVRNGADSVTACDAFEPAARCAELIIAANGMSGRIKIIRKRSTDLVVPDDMAYKANILVTEVFDTELIGEGAISTFRHALEHLLEPNCIVVPSTARMYVQPVESSYLNSRNQLKISLGSRLKPVSMPSTLEKYNNNLAAPLFDVQLSQLPQSMFEALSHPQVVFRFDFCGREELPYEDETTTEFFMEKDGVCHAFFMWWELDMDMDGDVILSCAPHWAHPDGPLSLQWRDHWMQAIFFPQESLMVRKLNSYNVVSRHDEYSLAFDLKEKQSNKLSKTSKTSSDMLHCIYTRARLSMLQDSTTIDAFHGCITNIINNASNSTGLVALCASESSFLPFLLAQTGVSKVYVVESSFVGASTLVQSIIDYNNLSSQIEVHRSYEDIPKEALSKVNLIIGEPYFSISMLPWHDLYFWYIRSSLEEAVRVVPQSACLMAIAAQFEDLHKIRSPVGVCEGLDLTMYDKMIEKARLKSDEYTEPHSLWEYPCKALCAPICLMTFDLSSSLYQMTDSVFKNEGEMPIQCDGLWNGVALWMVYNLDDVHKVSHGVMGDIKPGQSPKWNMERKQAVHLPLNSESVICGESSVKYQVSFDLDSGDMSFNFTIS